MCVEGRRDPPPAAVLLGFRLVAVDPEAGTIEVAFDAGQQFLNPAGHIQGGFLAAMLDDTLGPALVATLGPGEWAPTISLNVQFLARLPRESYADAAAWCAAAAISGSSPASSPRPTGPSWPAPPPPP